MGWGFFLFFSYPVEDEENVLEDEEEGEDMENDKDEKKEE